MATPKPRKFEGSLDVAESAAAKTEAQTNETINVLPFFEGNIARIMGWPVEMLLRYHSGMLKAAEPMASGWIERRREAATSMLETIEKLAHCNDFQEAASIQREWFEGTIRRLDTDWHALADHAVSCSQEAMEATRQVAQTSSEAASAAMRNTSALAQSAAARGEAVAQQSAQQSSVAAE